MAQIKVYCEDCKYYWEAWTHPISPEWHWKNQCGNRKNLKFDEKTKSELAGTTIGPSNWLWYASNVDKLYIFSRPPEEINKNNNCKWFKPAIYKTKWYQLRQKKKNIYLKEKYGVI